MPDAVDGVYLGVDVGTSATRVSLVRPGGRAVVAVAAHAQRVLDEITEADGHADGH